MACAGSEAQPDGTASDEEATLAGSDSAGAQEELTTAAPSPSDATGDGSGKVAVVNEAVITQADLDSAVESFVQQKGQPVPEGQEAQVRQAVLDALIGRELLYQHSQEMNIKPAEEEVNQAFSSIRSNFDTEDAWTSYLSVEGVTEEEARGRVARNLAIEKVVQEMVIDRVIVSDEEIQKFYDENPQQMQRPETVRASHILLRVDQQASEAEKDPVRARAGELLSQAKQGADFAELAQTNSQDPGSAARGGDLGFFGRGAMVPEFEAAAFSLEKGQISDVVETQFGYHIIKVTDKRPAGLVSLEEAAEQISRFLKQQRVQTDVRSFVQELRGAADVQIF